MTISSRSPTTGYELMLVIFVLAIGGCKKVRQDDADKPVVSVQAQHPVEASIAEEIVGDAILAPVAQAAIQSKVTAPIKALYVQRGSRVRAGQLLATLENKDLAAAVLDSRGVYTTAQGAYTAATKQQLPQEETQARLDVEQAKATLALDQTILKGRSELLSQGAIPGRDVDTAQATVLQAQAAYKIAQQKFDGLKSVGRQASLQAAEGQLTSAKGKYMGSEAQLEYTSIRTPIAGYVTERPLFVGETALAGTAVITVMETSTLIAKVHLSQRQAQQLTIGGDATLTVPGIEEPVKASISLVSPALDIGSSTVEVWLRVQNREGRMKVGTTARATLKGRTIPKAILVPAEAVQRSSDTGGKTVMVVAADGTAHKRNVIVGAQTPDEVQIIDGIGVGDTVITAGGYGVDEGTKVEIRTSPSKQNAGEKE